MQPSPSVEMTGADVVLAALAANGIDWVFCNAGTDFPPVIEAILRAEEVGSPLPRMVPILHESVAVGMAHGYYLATGAPQAVMVHTNVGTANAQMGIINARSERIPIVVVAGRTPVSEYGRLGSRTDAIHWGQEMFDQAAMVREAVKWDYELRDGAGAADAVARAVAVAMSPPRGPVYLSLPREVLAEPVRTGAGAAAVVRAVTPATAPYPDPQALAAVAAGLARSRQPLIITSRGGRELFGVLGDFAQRLGIPVVQVRPSQLAVATDHPMYAGTDPRPWLGSADMVVVLDTLVPWTPLEPGPSPAAFVVHIGPDPLHGNVPMRSFRTDLAVTAAPHLAVTALQAELTGLADQASVRERAERVAAQISASRRRATRPGGQSRAGYVDAVQLSRAVGEVFDDGVVVSELGTRIAAMVRRSWDGYFGPGVAGGLGWGLPAALGIKLADPARLVVATVGDGSYVFANPPACHQAAASLGLGLVTVVVDNGRWEAVVSATARMYPNGRSVAAPEPPLTGLGPRPDYVRLAQAFGGHGELVEKAADLRPALRRAREVARRGGQALVAVSCPGGPAGVEPARVRPARSAA